MSSRKGKEKAAAGPSGLRPLNIPEAHTCEKVDEKRIERLLVLIHWHSETPILKPSLPRMIPHNMGFSSPKYPAKYDVQVEEHVAVGMIYGVRLFEEPAYMPNDRSVPPKITKRRVLIVTSQEAFQGLQFRGPNTEMWVENPFTGATYRIVQRVQTEPDSSIAIILCDDWDQRETFSFDLPELSARREDPDRDLDLRYIGLAQNSTTQRWRGHKSQARFRETYLMGAVGPRPPVSLGAPVITKAGNVCAVVVKAKDDGDIAIQELNWRTLLLIEAILSPEDKKIKYGDPAPEYPVKHAYDVWAKDKPNEYDRMGGQ